MFFTARTPSRLFVDGSNNQICQLNLREHDHKGSPLQVNSLAGGAAHFLLAAMEDAEVILMNRVEVLR